MPTRESWVGKKPITHQEIVDNDLDAASQTIIANRFRDSYLTSNHPDDLDNALHNYKKAVAKCDGDPALLTWILCHRLNLSLYELCGGRLQAYEVEDELHAALKTVGRIKVGSVDPRFKRYSQQWLSDKLQELYQPAEVLEQEELSSPLGEVAISGVLKTDAAEVGVLVPQLT